MGAPDRGVELPANDVVACRWQCPPLVNLFEHQVARSPAANALIRPGQVYSYARLNARVNQLARALVTHGVGPERLVATLLPRSADMVVAMLAIMKAGGVYVPVDPTYPTERIRFMLADVRPVLTLTAGQAASDLSVTGPVLSLDAATIWAGAPDNPGAHEVRAALDPSAAAYVIYTSGSTGAPKGVVVPHSAVPNVAANSARRFGIGPGDRVSLLASASFDASILEVFAALLHGATLVSGQPGPLLGAELVRYFRDSAITHALVTPSMLTGISGDGLPALRVVAFGGEVLPAALLDCWAPGRLVVNVYGPTEATVETTMTEPLRPGTVPTIGKPIPGREVYLLDRDLRPVPGSCFGEMYIGGAGVARGYLHRPGLTAQRFVADPYGSPGSRMYRTGDLARRLPDGRLDILGRVDSQVKIRGVRIELGEIEAAIARQPGVAAVAVLVHSYRPGDQRLVAYVVPALLAQVNDRQLRRALARQLPANLVPWAVVTRDAMPMTSNGKVDRKALQAGSGGEAPTAAVAVRDGGRMFDDDLDIRYNVIVNNEEEYCIWPEAQDIPGGWREAGYCGAKPDCLAWIEKVWIDQRPLSLRRRL